MELADSNAENGIPSPFVTLTSIKVKTFFWKVSISHFAGSSSKRILKLCDWSLPVIPNPMFTRYVEYQQQLGKSEGQVVLTQVQNPIDWNQCHVSCYRDHLRQFNCIHSTQDFHSMTFLQAHSRHPHNLHQNGLRQEQSWMLFCSLHFHFANKPHHRFFMSSKTVYKITVPAFLQHFSQWMRMRTTELYLPSTSEEVLPKKIPGHGHAIDRPSMQEEIRKYIWRTTMNSYRGALAQS